MSLDDIWLVDPFNQTSDLTEEILQEAYTIRRYTKLGAAWYGIQLKNPPAYKNLTAETVRVKIIKQSNPSYVYSEVAFTTSPSTNQYRVDYDNRFPSTGALVGNYTTTGLIQFNPSEDGTVVLVSYWSTGKTVLPQNIADIIANTTIPGNLTLTGNLTAVDGTFSGNVSVTGSVTVGGTNVITAINTEATTRANADTALEIVFEKLSLSSWQKRYVSGTIQFIGAHYGNGLYIISSITGDIFTSPDAVTWTSRTSGTTSPLYQGIYANGLHVITGQDNTTTQAALYTSSNGITWTEILPGTAGANAFNGIAYGAGLYCAVGSSGLIYTSPDGITWTSRTSGVATSLIDLIFANSQFVAVGASNVILTSPDGITWTSRTSGIVDDLSGIAYGAGLYCAVGVTSGNIVTSPDGITWTSRTSGVASLSDIIFNNSAFISLAGPLTMITSYDGINWTYRYAGTEAISTGRMTLGDKNYKIVLAGGTSLGSIYVSP